jgi:hypothetical protein
MDRLLVLLPAANSLPMSAFGPSMDGWTGGWLLDPPQFDPTKHGAKPK